MPYVAPRVQKKKKGDVTPRFFREVKGKGKIVNAPEKENTSLFPLAVWGGGKGVNLTEIAMRPIERGCGPKKKKGTEPFLKEKS